MKIRLLTQKPASSVAIPISCSGISYGSTCTQTLLHLTGSLASILRRAWAPVTSTSRWCTG